MNRTQQQYAVFRPFDWNEQHDIPGCVGFVPVFETLDDAIAFNRTHGSRLEVVAFSYTEDGADTDTDTD